MMMMMIIIIIVILALLRIFMMYTAVICVTWSLVTSVTHTHLLLLVTLTLYTAWCMSTSMVTDPALLFEVFIKNCPTPTGNSTQENHTLLCSIPTAYEECCLRSTLCGSCCRQLQCYYSQRNIKEYCLPFGFLSFYWKPEKGGLKSDIAGWSPQHNPLKPSGCFLYHPFSIQNL